MRHSLLTGLLLACAPFVAAASCFEGGVFNDANGNGRQDAGEGALAGIKVSDGEHIVVTDKQGRYRLPDSAQPNIFIIKPAGYSAAIRADGLPDIWRPRSGEAGTAQCRPFALVPQVSAPTSLQALVMADSQTSNALDVDYFERDVIAPLRGKHQAKLGMTLGDITNDDPSLYPALTKAVTSLGVPWLHVPGNHDMDVGADSDASSLASYHRHLGPDTYAWEEPSMVFIGMDDIIAQPGQKPAYVGGLREDQFAFLERYLPTIAKDKLVVLGFHIPLFDHVYRAEDRARLFALLEKVQHPLILSGHTHNQSQVFWSAAQGWKGARPLHEYNVGAACGAFWSGVKDAQGIPDTTMADGTPNGYGLLNVQPQGQYSVEYRVARAPADQQIALHAPKVLRQGAYPAWGVYANVFMGYDGLPVEFRVDGGEWQPMKQVKQPDPRLLVENIADDLADNLRGYDRSPEAVPSAHLWRAALPTRLAEGEHTVEVRTRLNGKQYTSSTRYRLQTASP
ncbi:calcineurin-like phosphoesterase C-terminal domain-containing protein [Stenotrophomonas sp. SY1]|uniref:calcineurin-like phosphoesterase C-terminal domain-containing protein n=1 Tax=Stenotrophomonas sp. SY1 TaxID=477235 RepID=UPI001E48C2B2|nr:calcineurin-like phosphoesterase C-terminal domain-containing protein [Stenotrophomonas sp. SY1]MCD9086673.1 calcineurin-like phosphoesterase C-terminal domain-containing protein [Stenotrophomonas sp. SY1]